MDNIQSGQMLGPYRIINQIGRGGMANVYKAYQPSVDRYVAIKVLPSQLAESKEFAARFQQEARIIASLEHPHILPVFDYGESEGVAYFVMRYLEAGTLKDRMVAGRPLPLNEIDRLFTQLADALSYAHSRGVIHRDLKPANALIDSRGNVFLTDFGIARLMESASPRLTQTDAILGTPAYISPEQAQAHPVDQRSDIYSLGIILYEMVTGGVPFVAETPLAVLFKHISDPLPPPSVVKPDIPPTIEQVILKALAKNPDDRFDSATEFVEAWKRALEQRETVKHTPEAVTVPPARTITPAQPQQKTGTVTRTATKAGMPTLWIAGCLVAACAVFGLAGVALMAANLQGPPTATPEPPPTQTVVFVLPTAIPPTTSPLPTATNVLVSSGEILLEDDFSGGSDWGTLTSAESSVEYADNALHMQVFKENYVVWSTPNDETYNNIHLEVTVKNSDTDPTTAFGFICAQQSKDWSFYYLAATPGGEYAIIKATDGESDVFLTESGSWESSVLWTRNAPSYRVGADCGNGRLTLYVDGKQIFSTTDTTYGSGRVGLFTWSGSKATSADVTFDDFLVRSRD
jgi:tRNA A-37 threonylcarbamoyl transferase component Bud32